MGDKPRGKNEVVVLGAGTVGDSGCHDDASTLGVVSLAPPPSLPSLTSPSLPPLLCTRSAVWRARSAAIRLSELPKVATDARRDLRRDVVCKHGERAG